MSQSNEESADEPNEETKNKSEASSSCSSTTTITTTNTTSSSSNSSTSSTSSCCSSSTAGNSDNDTDDGGFEVNNSELHRLCQKSKSNSVENNEEINSLSSKQEEQPDRLKLTNVHNLSTNAISIGSSYSNLSSNDLKPASSSETKTKLTLNLSTPSPSPSLPIIDTIDTNNNQNSNGSILRDCLSSAKRTNFSKSASGSRLANKGRPSVCDCINQDCVEKKHSNRRQFLDHYYNSKTQLLTSANTSTSSFNINTPLSRLSECDAITRRLLSSPIRTSHFTEHPDDIRAQQAGEIDKSRRASLGTRTMTDQVFLFSSNTYKSLELSYGRNKNINNSSDNQQNCDITDSGRSSGENDVKFKQTQQQQQQQQGRSLSVCDEETLHPKHKSISSNHSSNLNRAISLACESMPPLSTRLLTIIPLFGCDINSLEQFTKLGLILPPVIDSAVDHILAGGINSIGIFRKSGVRSRILTLKQRIEANQNARFEEMNENNEFSIYDIADLIKMWFRELKPVPLVTKELIKLISTFLSGSAITAIHQPHHILKRGNSSHQQENPTSSTSQSDKTTVQCIDPILRGRINSLITPTHRALLIRALNFLARISSRCEANQMTSQNLAICLTPSLCETESDQNSIILAQKVLEYCIDNHKLLFG